MGEWVLLAVSFGPVLIVWLIFARYLFKHLRYLVGPRTESTHKYRREARRLQLLGLASMIWAMLAFWFGAALLRS